MKSGLKQSLGSSNAFERGRAFETEFLSHEFSLGKTNEATAVNLSFFWAL